MVTEYESICKAIIEENLRTDKGMKSVEDICYAKKHLNGSKGVE